MNSSTRRVNGSGASGAIIARSGIGMERARDIGSRIAKSREALSSGLDTISPTQVNGAVKQRARDTTRFDAQKVCCRGGKLNGRVRPNVSFRSSPRGGHRPAFVGGVLLL